MRCFSTELLLIGCFLFHWMIKINGNDVETNENVVVRNQHQHEPHHHHQHHLPLHRKHLFRVVVFQYFLENWLGPSQAGNYTCDSRIQCDFIDSQKLDILQNLLTETIRNHSLLHSHHHNSSHSVSHSHSYSHSDARSLVTVALYHIHSLWDSHQTTEPPLCQFQGANLTLYETLEPYFRYSTLFDQAKQYYDGYISTSSNATVQRVYTDAYLNESEFLSLRNFSSLIKGASYIATNCKQYTNQRENIIQILRRTGLRIDGLGNCLRSNDVYLEGINLNAFRRTNGGRMKLEIVNRYAFNMAFENTFEFGYVTEKPFDPLVAGSVPVYLGDSKHLKTLIPHPKAVIFVDDFPNLSDLANYLQYLLSNETAYEEHREWRKNFTYSSNIQNKDLLARSWRCRLCDWAVEQYRLQQHHHFYPKDNVESKISNRRCNTPK